VDVNPQDDRAGFFRLEQLAMMLLQVGNRDRNTATPQHRDTATPRHRNTAAATAAML
jgi:hypothetical protein